MHVLAFDTANEIIAIGIGAIDVADKSINLVVHAEVPARRASNTQLIPRIDALMANAGVRRSDIACVCCGRGPGSFTGVRICLATAKGIASALGVPLVGVSTLDAVAWRTWESGTRGKLLVVGDAMRKEVYPAWFRVTDEGVERLSADRVVKAEAFAEEVRLAGEEIGRAFSRSDSPGSHGMSTEKPVLNNSQDCSACETCFVTAPPTSPLPAALSQSGKNGTHLVSTSPAPSPSDSMNTPPLSSPAATSSQTAEARTWVVGDGLAKYGELFAGVGDVLPEESWTPSGSGLLLALQAAWRAGEADPLDGVRHNPGKLLPVYTRLSDAEENERRRLSDGSPRNLQSGVQDARTTMHAASQVGAMVGVDGVVFAPLGAAHANEVAQLEASLMSSDAWNAAMVADDLPRADRTWWRAGAADGSTIGYCGGLVADGDVQILKVAVAPEQRRRGIARQLIQRVCEDARNLGATTASLEVRASNAGAQAFYCALGFVEIGTRPRYYSDGEDATIMRALIEDLLATGSLDQVPDQTPHAATPQDTAQRPADERPETAAPPADAKHSIILAIESSCDETAAAVIDGNDAIRSDVVASQVDFHARFGGVVPEIASRKHIEAICGVCDQALEDAGVRYADLDALAVTYAPGLVGALVVGVAFAKGAAWAADIPFIGVNHLEGHLYANKLAEGFQPPAVVSLVSGGNTMLVHMRDWGAYEVLGATIDDAVGEAFDKVAKALGLPYPGGPHISRLAAEGDPAAIDFPRAMLHSGDLRFSLSGLKTAVTQYINAQREAGQELNMPDICASFQAAVIDVQVAKARTALRQTGAPTFCLGGGVAANPELRAAYEQMCAQEGVHLIMPPLSACGDNAAMIALVALDRYRANKFFSLDADALAHADLSEPY